MHEECEMEGSATDRQKQHVDRAEADQTQPSYWDHLIQHTKKAVEEAPEVRAERVAAMKRALRNGTLNLRGRDLADKLLRETLNGSNGEV
jgi:anti-sigma28 factor (negative regulator of flagellin synthesis)